MCFFRMDDVQALKYMILKTQVKMHEDILKFARFTNYKSYYKLN